MLEPRAIKGGFTYVWDQDKFNPINARDPELHPLRVHRRHEAGQAFTYDWRYWSIPELTELLKEAGYSDVGVYWDSSTDDDVDDSSAPRARKTSRAGSRTSSHCRERG